jgi:hypothetical protein
VKEQAERAAASKAAWKEGVRAAVKAGDDPAERPAACDPGPKPPMPRLVVSDATIEKLSVILAEQPRGTLVVRDEQTGWLQQMTRYTSGTDRPFWLRAYGGHPYGVERMGRDPVHVAHLTIAVVGGIQPDRLRALLLQTDDDGLLGRLLPVWPDLAPLERPTVTIDGAFAETAFERLLTLQMSKDASGHRRSFLIHFSEDAQERLQDFRKRVRLREHDTEGLLLSFLGKLPGLVVRLSLVLAFLDWSGGIGDEPHRVTEEHLDRAVAFAETYLLPMARRAYAETSVPEDVRTGRRLVALIREQDWTRFSSREVQRLARKGLSRRKELDLALETLEAAAIIRPVPTSPVAQGGRPSREFVVNPALRDPRG